MSWGNEDSVINQLTGFGLQVEWPPVIGKVCRCPADGEPARRRRNGSGWYVLHEMPMDSGGTILVGAYGDLRESGGTATGSGHKLELGDVKLSSEQRAALRQRMAADRRKAELRRQQEQERAGRRAEAGWRQCQTNGDSDYLRRKGVHAHGVRFSPSGNMIIPMHDIDGRIWGLQAIYSDPAVKKKKGRDKDFWPAGLAKRGKFFLIGTPVWVVLVVEGYATGASIHAATGLPVAVAFDAGNLQPVAQVLAHRYRDARVLVCGDDDFLQTCRECKKHTTVTQPECEHCGQPHRKNNAGAHNASAAALAVGGAWLLPQFESRERKRWTDFNDLHQAEGLHVVRSQVESRIEELGWQAGHGRAGQQQGAAGADAPPDSFFFSMDVLLRDYVTIYSTETVFDRRRRMILSLSSLRVAAGKALVRSWLEHPSRKQVLPDDVVFDPSRDPDDKAICNLWGGWPTAPKTGTCDRLLDLFEYLCQNETHSREVFDWLMCWLAYPIQHPGAKMQTAVLMHGPEGSGKNMAFGAIRRIYDKYGGIFSQTELESQFNGWCSGKLFMIGNEVVSRVELYQQQGRLKNMITEPEWQVNEKNLPTRLEDNHCNFMFFSNRLDIAKLDRDDRRYCVVWTPPKLGKTFYAEVKDELDNGGVAALHQYLLDLDLGDFSTYTEPPLTRAKADLADLSADSADRFWRQWQHGEIPLPLVPVRSPLLFQAYVHWSRQQQLPRPVPMHIFVASIGKKMSGRTKRAKYLKGSKRVTANFVYEQSVSDDPPMEKNQIEWLTDSDARFINALEEWREETV